MAPRTPPARAVGQPGVLLVTQDVVGGPGRRADELRVGGGPVGPELLGAEGGVAGEHGGEPDHRPLLET